ncbi:hypothetical protein COX08_00825 [Candidatus Beckwithbacteria bacterium CG23_combo_of_CG06-09_8_20_14_all_34_8]|uniref:Uncharacterized protein n=1 Tax=Candidatus Beckwithbacteria bacterium CG23_combo_of_CG06-09_8_20_14_all_34_8 TaxID=1974497 RepID=A0A2H0B715_9BACT|nr:MAG: hypothetical protein COX08_00825 [Candidatus Beckwithbacteria bacterium CG23_combo_of_CG06-09_8_20_14_all_34_8]
MTEQVYNVNLSCNDTTGNHAYAVFNFTYDITSPTLNFTFPTPVNATQVSRSVIINTTHSDTNPYYIWINWNGTVEQNQTWTGTFSSFTKNNLVNGNYTFNVTIMDKATNKNYTSDTRWVNINGTVPVVSLTLPTDNSFNNTGIGNFTCDSTAISGRTLMNMTFYWNYTGSWTANETISIAGNTSYNYGFYRSSLTDKKIIWNCLAYDNESDNSFSATNYTYIIDLTNPSVANNTGFATELNHNWYVVNFSVSDTNLHTILLNWNGTNESFDNISSSYYSENKSLSDGNYTYYAYANDTAMNSNTSSVYWLAIDYYRPVVTISSPANSSSITTASLPLSIPMTYSITNEFPFSSCYYNVTDYLGGVEVANTDLNYSATSTSFIVNSAGVYSVNMYATSATGTVNNTNSSFTVIFSVDSGGGGGGGEPQQIFVQTPVQLAFVGCGDHFCDVDGERGERENSIGCPEDCKPVSFETIFTDCVYKDGKFCLFCSPTCIFRQFLFYTIIFIILFGLIIYGLVKSIKAKKRRKKKRQF